VEDQFRQAKEWGERESAEGKLHSRSELRLERWNCRLCCFPQMQRPLTARDARNQNWLPHGSNRDYSIRHPEEPSLRNTLAPNLCSDAGPCGGSMHGLAQRAPASRSERMFRARRSTTEIWLCLVACCPVKQNPKLISSIEQNPGSGKSPAQRAWLGGGCPTSDRCCQKWGF